MDYLDGIKPTVSPGITMDCHQPYINTTDSVTWDPRYPIFIIQIQNGGLQLQPLFSYLFLFVSKLALPSPNTD